MRWVAYVSLETGAGAQVYVRPFEASGPADRPSVGVSQWQISTNAGNWPQWRGEEIVFNTAPGGSAVFAATVTTDGTAFEHDASLRLPFPPSVGVDSTPQSAVDGLRFLTGLTQVEEPSRPSISIVLNWPALLKP
jgi:hypothetical protein